MTNHSESGPCPTCTFDQPHTHDIAWTQCHWVHEIAAGQIVRLEHGDGSILVREVRATATGHLYVDGLLEKSLPLLLKDAVAGGFSLFVPAPTTPPLPELPSADGIYADKDGDPWIIKNGGALVYPGSPSARPGEYAPFVRLEPRADTAKAFASRARYLITSNEYASSIDALAVVAAEFGVTGE